MARDGILTAAGGILLALPLLPALAPASASAGAICPETEDVQLTVGQTKDAGDVKVCNDDDTLTVTYEATYPFCLLGTDLHVATIPEPPADPDANIPQNRQGRPTPDAFAYGDEYDPCAGTDGFEIRLDEIGEEGVSFGDRVAVAARADLEDEDLRVEEAWGQGTRFTEGGSWAMYFTYELAETPITSCVCDDLQDSGGTTGAEILASLCPSGEIASGTTGTVSSIRTSLMHPDIGAYIVRTLFGGIRNCTIKSSSATTGAERSLSVDEFDDCQAHLRGTCGL